MMKMMLGFAGSARAWGVNGSEASSAAPRIASVRNIISPLLANRRDFRRLPRLVRDVFTGQIGALLAPVGGRRFISFRHLSLTHIGQCGGERESDQRARNDLAPGERISVTHESPSN